VEADDHAGAAATVQALADRILANPVLEEVRITVTEVAPA